MLMFFKSEDGTNMRSMEWYHLEVKPLEEKKRSSRPSLHYHVVMTTKIGHLYEQWHSCRNSSLLLPILPMQTMSHKWNKYPNFHTYNILHSIYIYIHIYREREREKMENQVYENVILPWPIWHLNIFKETKCIYDEGFNLLFAMPRV